MHLETILGITRTKVKTAQFLETKEKTFHCTVLLTTTITTTKRISLHRIGLAIIWLQQQSIFATHCSLTRITMFKAAASIIQTPCSSPLLAFTANAQCSKISPFPPLLLMSIQNCMLYFLPWSFGVQSMAL